MKNIQKLIFNNNVLDVSNISSDSPIKQLVLNTFFPVGSIYMDATGKINPNTQFGGTWVKIENRFLYGQGTKATGATGGAETVTLSVAQMPSHYHNRGNMEMKGVLLNDANNQGTFGQTSGVFTAKTKNVAKVARGGNGVAPNYADFQASRSWTGNTNTQGSTKSHENMPPYIVVAIWKRTV